MDRASAFEASGQVFQSGCGDGLGPNQRIAATNFVAEALAVVPGDVSGVSFSPEPAADGWLSSGTAVLLGQKGSVAVKVDTRAGEFADRVEVKCELKFFSIHPGRWKIVRISEGIAVGPPHDVCNKSVVWHFDFKQVDVVEQIGSGELNALHGHRPDETAVDFVSALGWS